MIERRFCFLGEYHNNIYNTAGVRKPASLENWTVWKLDFEWQWTKWLPFGPKPFENRTFGIQILYGQPLPFKIRTSFENRAQYMVVNQLFMNIVYCISKWFSATSLCSRLEWFSNPIRLINLLGHSWQFRNPFLPGVRFFFFSNSDILGNFLQTAI